MNICFFRATTLFSLLLVVCIAGKTIEITHEAENTCIVDFFHKTRIYLFGDSLLKQMFDSMDCVTKKMNSITPRMGDKHFLPHSFEFNYKDGPTSYLIGNFHNATPMAIELYKGHHPSKHDVLVVLFGAHSKEDDMESFRIFMENVYHEAVKFPGQVFWLEPFPQHFKHGIYLGYPEPECRPLTKENSASQFWRVEMYRKIVKPSKFIHLVSEYNTMAPLWQYHKRIPAIDKNDYNTADCTHYSQQGWKAALLQLAKVVDEVFGKS